MYVVVAIRFQGVRDASDRLRGRAIPCQTRRATKKQNSVWRRVRAGRKIVSEKRNGGVLKPPGK
jgi:hypothetical protein